MKYFLLFIFFLIFTSSLYGYVDMTDTLNRARDLNMRKKDYSFAMAIAGTFTGGIFGLFLWKVK